ncbi:hypothetical protein QM797_05815 [Rhodococcus sp. IEGM 1381]|uniref:lipopolysaccharide biosynthesis protein n=1 Tax=Rhodococcus sp. IEGM 1381 TaxID=3047085 RepID=UPI0024B7056D|nr:hypothetical protein [Rhodococcus sp. IEGM 1381]MDI9894237.1 hypothetical protein [Rhodococcus sp. IEGM 1381]
MSAGADASGASSPMLDHAERRSLLRSTAFRVGGTPVIAVAGLVTTGITIASTGEIGFGLVALVGSVAVLFPFADLGIGATVTTACSRSSNLRQDLSAQAVIGRAYRVLGLVALSVIAVALVVMAVDGWGTILGIRSGANDRWAVTLAVALFGLSIPAGLGLRILVGIDRTSTVVLVMMSNSLLGMGVALVLYSAGVEGIWFVLPPIVGALLGNAVGTVVAARAAGLGPRVVGFRVAERPVGGLLAGSLWMFVISIGIPFGLQVQRVVLAHRSTPDQLSQYSLFAQMYAIGWTVFSTAALTMWPMFVRRRSDATATVTLWLTATGAFAAGGAVIAVAFVLLGPWVGTMLSGGDIGTPVTLAAAFAVLLVLQCAHLPAGMLLTTPREARWQAGCLAAMAVITLVGTVLVAPTYGAVGVVGVTAIAVLLAQVLPDLLGVPRLVRQRRPVDGMRT